MQAIILAAGEGRRLDDPTGLPKCLQQVGDRRLLEHQLDALDDAGVDDVTLVVGHEQQRIREVAGDAVRYVVNHRYAATNSMCSFLLAGANLSEDVLVMNADLLVHPDLVLAMVEAGGDALLYDSGSGTEAEHMKVRHDDDVLVEMSKRLPAGHVDGENVGMLRLSLPTARHTVSAAERLARKGHQRAWLAEAINDVAPDHAIRCLDVVGIPWIEIDFPDDLHRARTEVLPSVLATSSCDVLARVGVDSVRSLP